jgi:glyoxylase-like metal-dependent hydrolase (beta-lactamase superfamily II)
METGSYQFTIGEFTCIAVADGGMNYPVERMFANVPLNEVQAELRRHDLPVGRVYTPYTCLLVDTGDHRVLVDTGAGGLGAHAPQMMPGIDHTTTVTGHLPGNLRAAGIEPSTVDNVVITHAHPDHIGGNLTGEGALAFPNAVYLMGEAEWQFWYSEEASSQLPPAFVEMARQNLDPLRDRLTLIHDGDEIVPGIRAFDAFGHTPGHMGLEIRSGGQMLLHICDVALHPLHLEHPDWLPGFDMLPEEAAESKRRTLDRAAEEECLVFAYHFPPFPNLGYVRKAEGGWAWQPVRQAASGAALGVNRTA